MPTRTVFARDRNQAINKIRKQYGKREVVISATYKGVVKKMYEVKTKRREK